MMLFYFHGKPSHHCFSGLWSPVFLFYWSHHTFPSVTKSFPCLEASSLFVILSVSGYIIRNGLALAVGAWREFGMAGSPVLRQSFHASMLLMLFKANHFCSTILSTEL